MIIVLHFDSVGKNKLKRDVLTQTTFIWEPLRALYMRVQKSHLYHTHFFLTLFVSHAENSEKKLDFTMFLS